MDIIVTVGTPPVRAAKNATATIPIVMAGSTDPVERGLVASLARPGGNITGVARVPVTINLFDKGLQLLKEAAPNISRVAVLHAGTDVEMLRSIAESMQLVVLPYSVTGVRDSSEYEMILSRALSEGTDALFVFDEFVNAKYNDVLMDFTLKLGFAG